MDYITSNTQLSFLLKRYYPKYDCHVVALDKLSQIKHKTKQLIIVNFQKAGMIGTHWVGIACKNALEAVYFDSFGIDAPVEVKNFMKGYKVKSLLKTTKSLQEIDDTYCGYAVLLFFQNYILKNMEAHTAVIKMNRRAIFAYAKTNKKLIEKLF